MTDTVAPTTAPTTATRRGRNAATLFGIGIVLGGLVILFGNVELKKGDNGGLFPALVSALILLAVATLLWFVVLPRVKNVSRTAVILSVLAILSAGVFWLGITQLLAAAAIAVAATTTQLSKVAAVLRVIAAALAVVAFVFSVAQSRVF